MGQYPGLTMGPPASICHLLHLHVGHIIPKGSVPLPSLYRLAHGIGHEFHVYPHLANQFEIPLQTGKERGLLVEFSF